MVFCDACMVNVFCISITIHFEFIFIKSTVVLKYGWGMFNMAACTYGIGAAP